MTTTKSKRKPKTLAHVKKLSTLLAIGLRDLRKQERAKNSEVDMGEWLDVSRLDGKCTACLAGSVMRFSIGQTVADFGALPQETSDKLSALNRLRSGRVECAACFIGITTKLEPFRNVPQYDGPNGEWWKAMRQLLKDLKAAGE